MKLSNQKLPTLKDVARLAGTSISTVSCVLNNDSQKYVSDILKEKVQDAAKTLNYRPNFIARSMKGKKRHVLAIIVPQFENVFYTKLINGAEKVSFDNGFMLLFCSTYDDRQREQYLVESLMDQQVDGFLIAPTLHGWENTRFIRERNIPFVVVDRYMVDADQPYDLVGFDNEIGSYQATKLFIELGHRQLAYFNWESLLPHILQRQKGFWRAIDESGIPRENCCVVSSGANQDCAYHQAQSLFAQYNPTAILTAHHYLAEGLVAFLRETGRRIPDDVSVITYGQPSWVRVNVPNFSCIQQPAQEIGELGAKMLLERMEKPDAAYKKLILKPNLIIRNSVKKIN